MLNIIITILIVWAVLGLLISWSEKVDNLPHWLWFLLSGPVIWFIWTSSVIGFVLSKLFEYIKRL